MDMNSTPAQHYAAHHAELLGRYESVLAEQGLAGILIFAGAPRIAYQDDRTYPFMINPWYQQWVPAHDHAWSILVLRPEHRPRLICHQPRDYWHVVPAEPDGFWPTHFDIVSAGSPDEVLKSLPDSLAGFALLGEPDAALAALLPGAINPPGLVSALQFQRLYKTPYEVACMREANEIAARAHLVARDAFTAGASEFGIHLAYLESTGQTEALLPYTNIVALNEHAATLHYDACDRVQPPGRHAFLIDAGADCNGYAADITRTWPGEGETRFAELVGLLDDAQQALIEGIRPGQSYVDLHLGMHEVIGGILAQSGLVDMPPAEMVATGVTSAFFPHGLGHHIGLQVHDVAGKVADPAGTPLTQPGAHPFLRNLRPVETGNVFTVEPGIYFIDQLLEPLREQPAGRAVNWEAVAALAPCGGVRIEDDIAVTGDGVVNLTRLAFAGIDG